MLGVLLETKVTLLHEQQLDTSTFLSSLEDVPGGVDMISCRYRRPWMLMLSAAITVVGSSWLFADNAPDTTPQNDVSLHFTGAFFSELSGEEKELLQEYRVNYMRLREFYQNITIEAHRTGYRLPRSADAGFPPTPGAELELYVELDYTFRANGGDYLRMDWIEEEASSLSRKKTGFVGILTPTEGFALERNGSNGRLHLVAHGKELDKYSGLFASHWFHTAPFGQQGIPLEHRLLVDQDGSYRLEKVEVGRESGEEIVSVSRLQKSEAGWSRLILRFYRNRSWALKESSYEGTEDGTEESLLMVERCTYDGEEDGIPLLSGYTLEIGSKNISASEETVRRRDVFEIKKITPGAVPLAEFDARGIIGKIGEKTTISRFRIIAMAIGLILVVISLCLHRRKMKAGA